LKRENPEQYWKQHSLAYQLLQQSEAATDRVQASDDNYMPEETIPTPPRRTSTRAQSIRSPPENTTSGPARFPPNMSAFRPQGRSPFASPARGVAFNSPDKQLGHDASSRIFRTLDEAKMSVDHVVPVTFEYPEKHGHNLLVHRFDESLVLTFPHATIKCDSVQIGFKHFVDTRDYPLTTGHIVLDGSAFLITTPSVPYYQLFDHEAMFARFPGCPTKVKEDHAIWANAVKKKKSRLMTTILLTMPDEVSVTSDIWSPEPCIPFIDKKVKLKMGEVPLTFNASKVMVNRQTTQVFLPAYWNLRVISNTEVKMLHAEEEDEQDDLCYAFEGMMPNKSGNATGSSYF
jgi:hypothetical protein